VAVGAGAGFGVAVGAGAGAGLGEGIGPTALLQVVPFSVKAAGTALMPL
jgi:hypothetical protein